MTTLANGIWGGVLIVVPLGIWCALVTVSMLIESGIARVLIGRSIALKRLLVDVLVANM